MLRILALSLTSVGTVLIFGSASALVLSQRSRGQVPLFEESLDDLEMRLSAARARHGEL